MNTHGWHAFKCDYFLTIVRQELSARLADIGFHEHHVTTSGGITYILAEVFLEFNYDRLRYPTYVMGAVIGIGESAYNEIGEVLPGIPMWYLVPNGQTEPVAAAMRFANPAELRTSLHYTYDSFVVPYVVPLASNQDAIEKYVTEFRLKYQ